MDPMTSAQIIEQTIIMGASSAGIASFDALSRSPTYAAYPFRSGSARFPWPEAVRSVLVFTLSHPRNQPELDYWSERPGGTLGNQRLIRIARRMKDWLQEYAGIAAVPLPYQIDVGGIFLKDAASLAGLGVIGRNNLLVTPEYGTSVRLRAMFLEAELAPTGPIPFAPCDGCPAPCLRACPQNAFDSGRYLRTRCEIQMEFDRRNPTSQSDSENNALPYELTKFCRICEYACPVAR